MRQSNHSRIRVCESRNCHNCNLGYGFLLVFPCYQWWFLYVFVASWDTRLALRWTSPDAKGWSPLNAFPVAGRQRNDLRPQKGSDATSVNLCCGQLCRMRKQEMLPATCFTSTDGLWENQMKTTFHNSSLQFHFKYLSNTTTCCKNCAVAAMRQSWTNGVSNCPPRPSKDDRPSQETLAFCQLLPTVGGASNGWYK